MAPKFALLTKGSKFPLNQGFQNRFLVTTVSRQALDMIHKVPVPGYIVMMAHLSHYFKTKGKIAKRYYKKKVADSMNEMRNK